LSPKGQSPLRDHHQFYLVFTVHCPRCFRCYKGRNHTRDRSPPDIGDLPRIVECVNKDPTPFSPFFPSLLTPSLRSSSSSSLAIDSPAAPLAGRLGFNPSSSFSSIRCPIRRCRHCVVSSPPRLYRLSHLHRCFRRFIVFFHRYRHIRHGCLRLLLRFLWLRFWPRVDVRFLRCLGFGFSSCLRCVCCFGRLLVPRWIPVSVLITLFGVYKAVLVVIAPTSSTLSSPAPSRCQACCTAPSCQSQSPQSPFEAPPLVFFGCLITARVFE
jgi:hypothetical protein